MFAFLFTIALADEPVVRILADGSWEYQGEHVASSDALTASLKAIGEPMVIEVDPAAGLPSLEDLISTGVQAWLPWATVVCGGDRAPVQLLVLPTYAQLKGYFSVDPDSHGPPLSVVIRRTSTLIGRTSAIEIPQGDEPGLRLAFAEDERLFGRAGAILVVPPDASTSKVVHLAALVGGPVLLYFDPRDYQPTEPPPAPSRRPILRVPASTRFDPDGTVIVTEPEGFDEAFAPDRIVAYEENCDATTCDVVLQTVNERRILVAQRSRDAVVPGWLFGFRVYRFEGRVSRTMIPFNGQLSPIRGAHFEREDPALRFGGFASPLSEDESTATQRELERAASGCLARTAGTVRVRIEVHPSGAVIAAANAPDPIGSCVEAAARSLVFAPRDGFPRSGSFVLGSGSP